MATKKKATSAAKKSAGKKPAAKPKNACKAIGEEYVAIAAPFNKEYIRLRTEDRALKCELRDSAACRKISEKMHANFEKKARAVAPLVSKASRCFHATDLLRIEFYPERARIREIIADNT